MASPPAAGRPSYIGARLPRVEDERLAAGRHEYVADLKLPGMVELALVRSPHAHAKVAGIDTSQALASPGVLTAVAAGDLAGVSPVPDFFAWARPVATFPLARDRVRYVGAPVVAVVAADRYLAEDAAELVEVDYEELPAVASIQDALAPGAPTLYDGWPDNRMVDVPAGSPEVDDAFARAARVVQGSYTTQRHTAVPMEPRAALAEYRRGRLTLWTTTQFPHICRSIVSGALGLAERDVRVLAPDLGGGFGCKAEIYPEEFLVAWLAIRLGRPVRFVEDRVEHLTAAAHSRDMLVELEAAFGQDGTITALRGSVVQDLGSEELYPPGFAMAFTAAGSITGPYRIPLQAVGVTAVVTNKTPSGAYRGFGLAEACFAMERLLDKAARELGTDPVSLRRGLLLRPAELPYATASGASIDSGSHLAAFDRVVELGRAELARRRPAAERNGRVRVGIGFANYVEGVVPSFYPSTGRWTAYDACRARIDPDGTVVVETGLQAMGQGLGMLVATVTAEAFGVPIAEVRVVTGDTDATPYGLGSWGSRSAAVFAGACLKAAAVLKDRGLAIASKLLEADVQDLTFEAGRFQLRGVGDRGLSWRQVAEVAYGRTFDLPEGVEPGLETVASYTPPGVEDLPRPDGKMNACATYTNSSHAAVVGVELDTGLVRVLAYFVTHDCGTVINPMLVEGQVQGGVAQGIGGALLEELRYDDHGQPLSITLADYLLPTATDVPTIGVEHFQSPAPEMPFGVKGAGEAGVAGPAPAIVAAVEDALRGMGLPEITRTPLTPPTLLRHLTRTTP